MLTPTLTDATALERLSARTTLPVSAKVAVQIADLFARWAERRATRHDLRHLPPEVLKDIGLTRHDALIEASKPFWRA